MTKEQIAKAEAMAQGEFQGQVLEALETIKGEQQAIKGHVETLYEKDTARQVETATLKTKVVAISSVISAAIGGAIAYFR